MKTKRFVTFVLAASILVAAFPDTARAAGESAAATTPPVNLRAAIDRAAAGLAASTPAPAKTERPAAHGQAAYGGGGGGGKGMLIVTLVSTVVGLGATYYLMKEMKKQTDEAVRQAGQ